jgi:HEAT repeat protein
MRPNPSRIFTILFASVVLAACRSGGDAPESTQGESERYVPLPDDVQSIGYFLAVFDRSLAQWSQLTVASSNQREEDTLRLLEVDMQKRARERQDELLAELEVGAPINRRIAAAALGFTGDPTVLKSLLAVLADSDPEVVQRALLGIGVLAQPETPVDEIRHHLLNDRDAWTRGNAAFALLELARAGNASSELLEGCRAALGDTDSAVRAQCASALGEVADPAAIEPLTRLLQDPVDLVALAATFALARIGREHPEQKGVVARALAGALEEVREDRRAHVLGSLRWLRGEDLGEDAAPWIEWGNKLP